MKKLSILAIALIIFLYSSAQQIIDMQAYSKLGGTRVTVLLSNNTMMWYSNGTGWQTIPKDGLDNRNIVKLAVYQKTSLGENGTRLVAVADDNSLWWYLDGKPWEKVPTAGLPAKYSVKILTPYFKPSGIGWTGSTRYLLVQNDNSMWCFIDDSWVPVSSDELPGKYEFKSLKSYQKYGMMGGSETRYIGVLKDNTIWWSAGKKWQEQETKGLTEGVGIKLFDVYMKFSIMGQPEGRLVCVQDDNTFWFVAAGNKIWKKIDNKGLPANYKVKFLKVFQNWGSVDAGRLLITLEDNSIWWFDEGKGWTAVDVSSLNLK